MRRIQGYGWRPSIPDHRDWVFGVSHKPGRLRQRVSLRDRMPPVYDQGQLGSCTANAIAGAFEYEQMRQGEVETTPSRLWVYYQERVLEGTVNQDAGAEIRDGLKVVANLGVPAELDWPYEIGTFTGPPPNQAVVDASGERALSYWSLVLGSPGAPLRSCLSAGFPFVFGFSVPQTLESQAMADGSERVLSLPGPEVPIVGGHAVCAVGYDFTRQQFPVDVIEVRNSWGDQWCDRGHFYMDAAWFSPQAGLVDDLWTIRTVT